VFHFGIPCERWLRTLVNRVDPILFGRCFEDWIKALWPGRHDLIAIDGKTARRTHDKAKGLKALHTLSAYATNARLTLAQLSVPEKTNEITAIPELLDHLAETGQLAGALVTIDAMGCQVAIADKIVAHKADFLLALKGNQLTLETEVEDYFRTAPADELVTRTTVEKGHGRIETRFYTASAVVDWIKSDRNYPGQPRFNHIKTLVRVVNRTELKDRCTVDERLFISSARLDIERLAQGVRGHWGVEKVQAWRLSRLTVGRTEGCWSDDGRHDGDPSLIPRAAMVAASAWTSLQGREAVSTTRLRRRPLRTQPYRVASGTPSFTDSSGMVHSSGARSTLGTRRRRAVASGSAA